MILDKINGPEDIKALSIDQLSALADELREYILDTVNVNGGHLSSNLGTVELILALHYVFSSPRDKLVFDVGHQAYVHKIITGRRERFSSLRREEGISGFPRMDESDHDAFTGGHASNAISAAVGMARARDIIGDDYDVVAVVGDGAMTGGMCYEALNDIGQEKRRLLVVLNDNQMSISKNVGAISRHLTNLRQSTAYMGVKRAFKRAMLNIPSVGPSIVRGFEAMLRRLRRLLTGDQFFGALGMVYHGPIDGHDIKRLIKAIKKARQYDRPVLLHIVTRKGSGYEASEARPDKYHGVAPHFVDPENGEAAAHQSNGEAACAELIDLARTDGRISVVTAAMPMGTGMLGFERQFPGRFFDVGIAEGHMVTMAAGMAAAGMRPYVAVYSTFLQRGYDQLIHDVCIANLPVTLLIDRGGLVGPDGCTHNGAYDLSYLRHIPNMVVAAPRDTYDLKKLIRLSAGHDGPMAIRYPKDGEDLGRFRSDGNIQIGEWELILDGEDAVILAVGPMVSVALKTAILLMKRGVRCGVVDARFIKPIDKKMLQELSEMGRLLVTLEDNAVAGGFGSAVMEALASSGNFADRVLPLGIPDAFIEHATIDRQREMSGLSPEAVAESVRLRLASTKS